jgi:hypothetical protein
MPGADAGSSILEQALASLAERTRLVDKAISDAAAHSLTPRLAFPFTICAVGGYGRSELFPYSDIDLLILADSEDDLPLMKDPLSDFLRVVWDAGLRASQSVRTVAECCRLQEQNIELHISLLDLRFVYGNAELFQQLSGALPAFYREAGRPADSRTGGHGRETAREVQSYGLSSGTEYQRSARRLSAIFIWCTGWRCWPRRKGAFAKH